MRLHPRCMADKKPSKNNNALVIVLAVLGLLVLINIIMSFQDRNITGVTGRAVADVGSGNEDLANEVTSLRNENERLVLEKDTLSKKIDELEAKLKVFEDAKELEEETCPLPCDEDELCSPINKLDGSVEWQCVDDPAKFV